MNNKLIISIFSANMILLPNLSLALPAPCTQEELLQSSDFAIEGTVTKIECGEPYDSKQCSPKDGVQGFIPELIAKCSATVMVEENIKGDYNKGDEAVVPYLQLVQKCDNGTHMIPGSPIKNVVPNSEIKYYHSKQCEYWNYIQITVPPSDD